MSDYLMRLVERLRPGRQTLQPALPSRFEPAKTGAAPDMLWREADESFAVVDDKGGHNSSAARLIAHDVARQKSSSTDDTLDQREGGDSTARAATQTPRPKREPEKLLVETKRLIQRNQPRPEPPTNHRPQAATNILDGTATIRGDSPSPTVRGSRIEPREEETMERPVTTVQPTEHEQFVLSPSRLRRIASEEESLRSPAALEPSQSVQSRLEGSRLESKTSPRHAEHELQHEPEGPASFPTSKSAVLRGELLPSSASFGRRTRSAERDEAHDARFFAAPEIRVTIGRIEVRAITPPAVSQSPAAPRTPKISLDDYLRSRNGTAA
jgi:hypothetical protein